MIEDRETQSTDGAIVSIGVARLLDSQTTEYMTQDELAELRRATRGGGADPDQGDGR